MLNNNESNVIGIDEDSKRLLNELIDNFGKTSKQADVKLPIKTNKKVEFLEESAHLIIDIAQDENSTDWKVIVAIQQVQ